MPSNTTFDTQDAAYKAAVLPAGVPRVAVEMGVTDGWWKYGWPPWWASTPMVNPPLRPVLFKHFGFTPENVADTVQPYWAKVSSLFGCNRRADFF
jgi:transketolase